jgi:hypothetical protein
MCAAASPLHPAPIIAIDFNVPLFPGEFIARSSVLKNRASLFFEHTSRDLFSALLYSEIPIGAEGSFSLGEHSIGFDAHFQNRDTRTDRGEARFVAQTSRGEIQTWLPLMVERGRRRNLDGIPFSPDFGFEWERGRGAKRWVN